MISVDEFIEKMIELVQWYIENRERLVIEAAFDLSDETKQRVINKGLNADGQKIGDYSEPYRTQKEARGRLSVNVDGINYRDSQEMYKSVFPRTESIDQNQITVSIKADSKVRSDGSGLTNEQVMDYLEFLTDKGIHNGYPIEFSLDEEQATVKHVIEAIQAKAKELGLIK